MDVDELLEDVRQAEQEVGKERKGIDLRPVYVIIGLFFILILVVWYIPEYIVKVDPPPSRIPTLNEVVGNEALNASAYRIVNLSSGYDFRVLVDPHDERIKRVANKVVGIACDGTPLCQAKALYYFVRDDISYVKDPRYGEYLEEPYYTLLTGAGDCDDHALLLANLYESTGFKTRFVFIPDHVYLEVKIPNEKRFGDWIAVDATCKSCVFGEVPYSDAEKRYVEN